MTRVTLTKCDDEYSVRARGHATGSIRMCAAISTLVYTLAGYLENTDDIAIIKDKVNDGDVDIQFKGGDNADVLYDVITVGFLELENTHPEYIKVFLKK